MMKHITSRPKRIAVLEAALNYAARGWPIFPVRADKRPLTTHGRSDATTDPDQIRAWWRRWPDASPALATGAESGVVAIDVDVSEKVYGFDALDELGVSTHPATATAHTPRGGVHMLFRHPGHHVKTVAGALGRGLDVRGDGGSIILPPGPGRFWDPHLAITTALAEFPAWAVIPEPVGRIASRFRPGSLPHDGEALLDAAVLAIVTAAPGQQEETLNRTTFSVGRLVAGRQIPYALATEALQWAAHNMPSHDPRRPWKSVYLDRKVDAALRAGMRQPRTQTE